MPEAKVPCESCPWPATKRRSLGGGVSDALKREAAEGYAIACTEDGGTCYGAVRFAMDPVAERWREPPPAPVGRMQGPDTPDHRPDFTTPTTAVDFVPTPTSDQDV